MPLNPSSVALLTPVVCFVFQLINKILLNSLPLKLLLLIPAQDDGLSWVLKSNSLQTAPLCWEPQPSMALPGGFYLATL